MTFVSGTLRLSRVVLHSLLLLSYSLPHAIHAEPSAERPAELFLGRLFFTPQQRAELDRRRLTNSGLDDRTNENSGSVSLNGVVRHSNSRITTWVNGNPRPGQGAVTSYDGGADAVTIYQSEREGEVRLRVGQTVNLSTGERSDGLQGGHVSITTKSRKSELAVTP